MSETSKMSYQVTKEQTAAFAKAWDLNGIKVIIDSTTIQFATDYANIVLKSFVADMATQVKKVAEAKLAAQKAAQGQSQVNSAAPPQVNSAPAPVKPKSRIILTDV